MRFNIFIISLCLTAILGASGLDCRAADTSACHEHYRLGQIYYEHGLYQEAQGEFAKAITAAAASTASALPADRRLLPDAPAAGEYVIGCGDTLQVTVWENSDLNTEALVRADGKISFPLLDEVSAAGSTLMQLDSRITKALQEYIRFPEVTVALKKMAGNRVMILGEVRNPGIYEVVGNKTLTEAIAMAGGITADAVSGGVVVVGGNLDHPKPQRVNLYGTMNGRIPNNMLLANQTIVYVPKKFLATLNYYATEILGPISSGATTGSTAKGLK